MRWDRLATCAEQSINLPMSCRFWWQLSQHCSWFLLLSFQYLSLTSVHPFFLWPATQNTATSLRRQRQSDPEVNFRKAVALTSSSDSPRLSVSRFKATSRFAVTTQTASKTSAQSASNSTAASKNNYCIPSHLFLTLPLIFDSAYTFLQFYLDVWPYNLLEFLKKQWLSCTRTKGAKDA